MRERFASEIESHALRREIIATVLSNGAINRGGSTLVVRLKEETGRTTEDVAFAFAAATGAFRLNDFYDTIDALDGKIDGQQQLSLYLLVQNVLRRQVVWFLRYGNLQEGLSALIERYRAGLDTLSGSIESIFDEWLIGRFEDAQSRMVAEDIPADLARRFSILKALTDGPDIILLATRLNRPELEVARLYFRVSSHFRVDEIRSSSEENMPAEYYDRLAFNSALAAVASAQRGIVEKIFAVTGSDQPDFEAWRETNRVAVARAQKSIDEILNGGELTLAKLTVAVAHLREVAEL
jgi:glutamate dehydrogenase